MNQRLQQFLAAENISQAQFADSINVARASVSHVLAGRNKPGYDFIRSIAEQYPKLNLEWLISGKGKMYKTDLTSSVKPIVPVEQPIQTAPSKEPDPVIKQQDLFSNTEEKGLFQNIDNDESESFSSNKEESLSINKSDQPNTVIQEESHTSSHTTQNAVKQRSIKKVIVLYDDDTYQELK